MILENFDLRGLVRFILYHTAGDKDLRRKVSSLQKSYDRVKLKALKKK